MAARVEKGILHAFRSEFPLPNARYACLECSLFFLNHQGLEIERSTGRNGRKESRFVIAELAAGTVAPAAGRGGQRVVLKSLLYQTG